jgi:magnesium transporter
MTTTLRQDELEKPVSQYMRRDYTALLGDQTVAAALEHLRSVQLAEKIIYFYVVDSERRLVGVVPTRRLLMSASDVRIGQIMVTNVISIPDTMTVLEACEFFVMHRLLAFPIVDGGNRLMGVVDVSLFTDEMFDVSEKQSAQDVFQLIGVRLAMGRRASPFVAFRERFPWLLCNIGGGIACAFLAGMYERFLDSVIVLALFIPVVLALAESVSVQSMTLTLQSLHGQRVSWRKTLRSVGTEFLTSMLLGCASGLVVGIVAWVWKRQPAVAAAIGLSICLAIITACLLGILLPTAVRALRGDPKIAAGPIVLATADVATLLFYFNLAGWILG